MATILLIEDETAISNAYARALAHAGHHVILATRGSQALAIIEHQTFDVVLLDLMMPELNGLDFLEKSKFSKRFPETKVIVLTNAESDDLKARAKQLGVNHFLIKVEYTPYGLATTLEKLLTNN